MLNHIRAMIAAAAYAFVTRTKVAGVYDHACALERRIAAESRGDELQGLDGDRSAKFGGRLPEIYDGGEKGFVSFEIDGDAVRGYDRISACFYLAQISRRRVHLYDYGDAQWVTFDIRDQSTPAAPAAVAGHVEGDR